jgi:hypothetical protein
MAMVRLVIAVLVFIIITIIHSMADLDIIILGIIITATAGKRNGNFEEERGWPCPRIHIEKGLLSFVCKNLSICSILEKYLI